MKKSIFLFCILLCNVSLYSADLVLDNFNDVTTYRAVSGAWGSTWNTVERTGKLTVPANNTIEYIYFSLPAGFDANLYKYLKISVKSTETNYRFDPILITPEWAGVSDVTGLSNYTGAGAWQDIYIPMSGMPSGVAGTYDKIALRVAANDAKSSFDMYIDNVTFVEAYVPNYTRNVTVCNFDNVTATTGAWGSNIITPAINPSGATNVGLVSVPANNAGGISFTTATKINTSTHNKLRFRVFATQTFKINCEKFEDKTNGATINQAFYTNLNYTTPNQWQELTIDLSTVTSNIYDRIILMAAAWQSLPAFTFYIDDLTLIKTPVCTYNKSLYFDFGSTPTPTGADKFGNNWNNITNPAINSSYKLLIDSIANATTFNLTITTGFSSNAIGVGGLASPEEAQIGKFAIGTATGDYFYGGTGAFKVDGLDKNKAYVFSFFGSRYSPSPPTVDTRTTKFSLVGSNTTAIEGTQTTTGIGIGTVAGAAYNGNTNSIYTTTPITPDATGATGAISITVTKASGANLHLSVMKIMESTKWQQTITLAPTAAKTTNDVDFSPATASSGLSVTYTSSNPSVAKIVDGQVHIVDEGITTITAWQAGNESFDEASEVSQTLIVTIPSIPTGIDKSEKSSSHVFVNEAHQITILAPEKSYYLVYNAVGMKVANGLTTSNRTVVNNVDKAGVYVVRVSVNGKWNSGRVIINGK